MAAYAALLSFMNTTDQIMNHPRFSTSLDKNLIESLREKVGCLQDFMENYSHRGNKYIEVLESRIASAAHTAEDVIEFQVVDQILAEAVDEWDSSSFILDLQKVIDEMDAVTADVLKIKELKDVLPTDSTAAAAASSRPITAGKNKMIGFDDELLQLTCELISQQSSRRIIPIVGMAGIGKTTLARNAYEDLAVVEHFDIRCWATISQDYDVKRILLDLLSCVNDEIKQTDLKNEDKFGEMLYKSLYNRRYLIVLDDMWNIQAWDKIKSSIPDSGDGSRIVVTTRQSEMASRFDSSFLSLKFLDEDRSWELLREKAFAEESCSSELEEIGKKIAQKCKGLPLSIVVIGGFLGKSPRTKEYWENVAQDMSSILNSGGNEYCLDILSLSYTYLPPHLKPCFLYMGTFPEDHEIRVSRLIKLWVAEGFLKPKESQTMEEVGEDCLKDLISRNLISVRKWGTNAKLKTCHVHDLLRDLCLKVGEKEKFFRVMRVSEAPHIVDMERRILFHESIPDKYHCNAFVDLQSVSFARSLVSDGGWVPFKFALLRVLNVVDSYSPEAIFKQVNLRYAAYKTSFLTLTQIPVELPSSISLLWNLQTLNMKGCGYFNAPLEIWNMPQLRHLKFNEIFLRYPDDEAEHPVLENLQTLSRVANFKCSEEVCRRVPNIKKLHAYYYDNLKGCEDFLHYRFGDLDYLVSLKWAFSERLDRDGLLQEVTFPSSLRELSLERCCLQWQDLDQIGLLPKLESLKLEEGAVVGEEWNPVEDGFRRLKYLKIGCSDLVRWNADNNHFPVLEEVFVASLLNLEEIPLDIGEIATLRVISLEYCSLSVITSAMKILEEQESLGNEDLRLRVKFVERSELEKFREYMEEEGFTNENVQATAAYDKSPFEDKTSSVVHFDV